MESNPRKLGTLLQLSITLVGFGPIPVPQKRDFYGARPRLNIVFAARIAIQLELC